MCSTGRSTTAQPGARRARGTRAHSGHGCCCPRRPIKRARLGMLVGALAAIGLWLPLLSRPKPGADESPRGATQRGAAVAETKHEAPALLAVARGPEAP